MLIIHRLLIKHDYTQYIDEPKNALFLISIQNNLRELIQSTYCASQAIGTSYLAKFQKRAVTNLKNYSTKNDENLRKPKGGQ